MLTYAKAKSLLAPGDIVYIVEGGIVELPIIRIYQESLTVPGGELYFEDVGKEWFLTKCCAKEALKRS